MPRSRFDDDEEMQSFEEMEDVEEESDDLADFDDLGDDLDDNLDAAIDDSDEDDDDDDEEDLSINRETEDWGESIDDMESDYWEDYTRKGG